MRHRKKVNHLGRKSAHRQAMLSNMAASLILHKRIKTTLQKAKALRVYVEPLINRSKDNTTHSRRIVFSYLQNKEAITELFRDIADKVANRPGGYTRILKIENRLGDNAEMCYIELVDYNENMLKKVEKTDAKKSGTRRGGKKGTKAVEESTESTEGTKARKHEGTEEDGTKARKHEGTNVETPVVEAETPVEVVEETPVVEEVAEVVEEAPIAEAVETPETSEPAPPEIVEEAPVAEETTVAEAPEPETPEVAEEAPAEEEQA